MNIELCPYCHKIPVPVKHTVYKDGVRTSFSKWGLTCPSGCPAPFETRWHANLPAACRAWNAGQRFNKDGFPLWPNK